jgi:hypothetical protein
MISSHSVASLFCNGKINLVPVIQLNLIEVMITWKLWNKNPQAKPPTSKDLIIENLDVCYLAVNA